MAMRLAVRRLQSLFLLMVSLTPTGVGQQLQASHDNVASERFAQLRERALAGSAHDQYLLGVAYIVTRDYNQAVKWEQMAAGQGLSDAQFVLGYLYEQGYGVRKDYNSAVQLYRAAAQSGHADAENNLASMYQYGRGVKRSLQEAFKWYRISAEHGNPVAQSNLAALYFRGQGVPQNYSQAVVWFRMAADAGNPVAQRSLGYMYCTGIGVALDYSEAVRFTRLAAEQGYALAETDLGHMYEQGKGVPLDYVAAYIWYSAGKVGGDERALSRLKSLSQLMGHGQIDEAERALSKVEEARRETPTVRQVPTDVQSSTKGNSAIPIKH